MSVALRALCASCGAAPRTGLVICSGCDGVAYCGPVCQRAHWKAHRQACKARAADRFNTMLARAEAGDAGMQFCVGTALYTGLGTPKSSQGAFSWYLRSANAGCTMAQFN